MIMEDMSKIEMMKAKIDGHQLYIALRKAGMPASPYIHIPPIVEINADAIEFTLAVIDDPLSPTTTDLPN